MLRLTISANVEIYNLGLFFEAIVYNVSTSSRVCFVAGPICYWAAAVFLTNLNVFSLKPGLLIETCVSSNLLWIAIRSLGDTKNM